MVRVVFVATGSVRKSAEKGRIDEIPLAVAEISALTTVMGGKESSGRPLNGLRAWRSRNMRQRGGFALRFFRHHVLDNGNLCYATAKF